ncbi:hypothetical protein A2875_02520 [Candidatus Gottesmanbacteria bacterium RIFCSPHIGHO2_01_FULL_46_14]|uniref:Glycosyltransferase 2-like domain-containing protein n=3 Tax=Microgenomates group TaxID=1794810 RepID=A0A1F5ZN68_9BACT|nr:MAG: Glycosyl transferase family 2 [Candidatus Curtissbacteria bacterium GW2011_GWA1_41_11]OGG13774.1 MAG: hypothetical protein A2875_02520 [Candidatus Gottesmanbacteria bacterium RIFCSPHIGHO2_01_FULL_46_14]OGG28624.1 MAG: hypothetical protein A2971_04795 [Candidatus Gottesmanbacteria bacterium RIFCSPLOWO2_01_FULL_46_21]
MDFTLILPCYNESEHLVASIEFIFRVLRLSRFTYEVLLIDDASTDGTQKIIAKVIRRYQNVRAFYHKQNMGRGFTVSEGIRLARSKIVGYIDVDCEVSPVYIPLFVDTIMQNHADIVVAHRFYLFHINFRSIIRTISSRLYAWLVDLLLPMPIGDTEAGYKFFNRRKIIGILDITEDRRWFWDTEILARSKGRLIVQEIPVFYSRNLNKTSTVHLVRDSIKHLVSLIAYRMKFI